MRGSHPGTLQGAQKCWELYESACKLHRLWADQAYMQRVAS